MSDPEERRGPGHGGPDPDGSVDEFDSIVAGWRREGRVPQWPGDNRATGTDPFEQWESAFAATPPPAEHTPTAPRRRPAESDPADTTEPDPAAPGPADPAAFDPSTVDPLAVDPYAADPDDHFVPPEPPPLPRLGPPALVGLALLGLGLLLVIAPSVLGLSSVYGLPLGLLALAAGLGWLVLRLWPAPMDEIDDDSDDDGAVL